MEKKITAIFEVLQRCKTLHSDDYREVHKTLDAIETVLGSDNGQALLERILQMENQLEQAQEEISGLRGMMRDADRAFNEHGEMSDKLELCEAQYAAYREALQKIAAQAKVDDYTTIATAALSSNAGRALLERLAKAEA